MPFAGGSLLSGKGFLNQMAIVCDIKADLSWDDIIPLDDRQHFEKDEHHAAVEVEAANPA